MERQGFRNPPVNVGDELDVLIEAVGEKGDGIAKKDGFVLFIPGVKQGDQVHIRISKVLRKVGFAEVVGSTSSKPSKAEPEEETQSEEEQPAEEETSSEDSEDFGEDQ
ncbi:MAG TPA: TRAM domain-containing protein [Candidatus Nanoarchaeia archaeon]|nr:TRAM domain-containing protein [Candidatus Nanoarchaeia archaeon]